MRARNIKPGFFVNEELAEVDPWGRLLFIGLWCLADREGKLEDRPKRIKGELFRFDEISSQDVDRKLDQLATLGLITRYAVEQANYIIIPNFLKHQSPHYNEKLSTIPNPLPDNQPTIDKKSESASIQGDKRELPRQEALPPDSLIPDIMNPDSLNVSPSGDIPAPPPEALPLAKKSRSKKQGTKPKTSLPDDFAVSERVRRWAEQENYGRLEEHLEAFKRKARANGYTYVSWDDAFMEAIRNDWADLRKTRAGPKNSMENRVAAIKTFIEKGKGHG